MKARFLALALALAALLAFSTRGAVILIDSYRFAAAEVVDTSLADITGTQGTNGWDVGWLRASFPHTFERGGPLAWDAGEDYWHGAETGGAGTPIMANGYWLVGLDTGKYPAVRWQATHSGTATISLSVQRNQGDGGDGFFVRAWVNDVGVINQEVPDTGTTIYTPSEELEIKKGDRIVINMGSDGTLGFDGANVSVTISVVTTPVTNIWLSDETEILSRATLDGFGWEWPDGTLGIEKIGTDDYRLTGAKGIGDVSGARPAWIRGSFASPAATSHDVSTITGGDPSDYKSIGTVFKDDTSGILIGFYHAERWTASDDGQPFWVYGGIVRSSNGVDWTDVGTIIRPTNTYAEWLAGDALVPLNNDLGGMTMIPVGSYLYVYAANVLSGGTQGVCRAPLADVISACVNLTALPTFEVYEGGGVWAGDAKTDFVANAATVVNFAAYSDVIFHEATGKYIMVGWNTWYSDFMVDNLKVAWSTDGLVWSTPYPINQGDQVIYLTTFSPGQTSLKVVPTGQDLYIIGLSTPAEEDGRHDGANVRRWKLNIPSSLP